MPLTTSLSSIVAGATRRNEWSDREAISEMTRERNQFTLKRGLRTDAEHAQNWRPGCQPLCIIEASPLCSFWWTNEFAACFGG
jgi:hypothetical protein